MEAVVPPLRAVVYDDDPGTQRALALLLNRCGFDVVVISTNSSDLLACAERTAPHVLVLDLALTGTLGLRIVPALRAVLPGCAVVLLSPFLALDGPARRAGACAVLDKSDLRPVEACLRRAALMPGTGCTCELN